MPGSGAGLEITVRVYQTDSGKQIIEYVLHRKGHPENVIVTSQDPRWIGRFLTSAKTKSDPLLKVFPETPLVFLGSKFHVFSTYSGPGEIIAYLWKIQEIRGKNISVASATTETLDFTMPEVRD